MRSVEYIDKYKRTSTRAKRENTEKVFRYESTEMWSNKSILIDDCLGSDNIVQLECGVCVIQGASKQGQFVTLSVILDLQLKIRSISDKKACPYYLLSGTMPWCQRRLLGFVIK